MIQGRRDFIKSGSLAASAFLLPGFDGFPDPAPRETHPDFSLRIMATNWGFGGTIFEFCKQVKKEGYDGIEIWWPREKQQQEDLFRALKENQLDVGFLCGGSQPEYTAHFNSFREAVHAATHNTNQRPLYINCHSGRDYFSFEENKTFIDYTTQVNKETGIRIMHETHRSRMLFAAPVARQYIMKTPELRITFDVSHWCNVSESLLDDQKDTVKMTLERTDHIHARIGHQEGPQVNDPRAPEWEAATKAHLNWWDQVVSMKKEKGEIMTILTEFGPPHYMPTVPYTRQPVADQWAINVYMMQMLRKRYLV